MKEFYISSKDLHSRVLTECLSRTEEVGKTVIMNHQTGLVTAMQELKDIQDLR
jgi:hypothetical protein